MRIMEKTTKNYEKGNQMRFMKWITVKSNNYL